MCMKGKYYVVFKNYMPDDVSCLYNFGYNHSLVDFQLKQVELQLVDI